MAVGGPLTIAVVDVLPGNFLLLSWSWVHALTKIIFCLCMYVCMYVCMYMCVYMYVYVSIYIYMYICMYMYVCMSVYVCLHFYFFVQPLWHFDTIPLCCGCRHAFQPPAGRCGQPGGVSVQKGKYWSLDGTQFWQEQRPPLGSHRMLWAGRNCFSFPLRLLRVQTLGCTIHTQGTSPPLTCPPVKCRESYFIIFEFPVSCWATD